MAQHAEEKSMSAAERQFEDIMEHADSFFKVELLNHAKSMYEKALEMHIDTERVETKIAECNRLLKFEKKVIWILFAIALVAVVVWYLVSKI